MAPKRLNPEAQARHQQVVEAFKSDPALTDAVAADRFGMSIMSITKIKQAAGLTKPLRSERNRPPVVSPLARAVGFLLTQHINSLPRSAPPAHHAVSMTLQRFNMVLEGRDFITLTQLERIASWMNMPLSQLLAKAEATLATCDARKMTPSGATGNSVSSSATATPSGG